MRLGCLIWPGIDQIAVEIEQPLDVLPLHSLAAGMSCDVADVLKSWLYMPSLPPLNDDDRSSVKSASSFAAEGHAKAD